VKDKIGYILEVLKAIENGALEVQFVPQGAEFSTPADLYHGNMKYRVNNGCELIVFNDCNSWDYLASVVLQDGEMLDLTNEDSDSYMGDYSYRPSKEVIARVYGIGEKLDAHQKPEN
jgi:hypothetical protein